MLLGVQTMLVSQDLGYLWFRPGISSHRHQKGQPYSSGTLVSPSTAAAMGWNYGHAFVSSPRTISRP